MWIYLATIAAGLLNAFVWAAYIKYVTEKRRLGASINDCLLLVLQYGVLQLWAVNANDIGVIICWIMSNSAGTFLVTGVKRSV